MTHNTFNNLNDHIHIHISSNTHQFLFYFVFILFLYIFWSRGYWVQFFWGGLCQFGCNIGSIQLEHLTSLSINEACRGRGDEYRDFGIHKNLGQFVIDNNNDVASSNKKHPFQLLPSCGNNTQFTQKCALELSAIDIEYLKEVAFIHHKEILALSYSISESSLLVFEFITITFVQQS